MGVEVSWEAYDELKRLISVIDAVKKGMGTARKEIILAVQEAKLCLGPHKNELREILGEMEHCQNALEEQLNNVSNNMEDLSKQMLVILEKKYPKEAFLRSIRVLTSSMPRRQTTSSSSSEYEDAQQGPRMRCQDRGDKPSER